MKNFIIIIFSAGTFYSFAQEQDSTAVEPNPIVNDSAVVKETIPRIIPPKQEEVINNNETQTPSKEPKIIYYQTTPEPRYDNRNSYSSSYSNRRNRSDIKTLAGSMNHSGGFGALSFRTTDFQDETMVLAGIRAGWIINRTVGIGVEGHGIIPTSKYSGIDLNQDVFALGGYGGMFLEMIILSNTVVHITFPTSAGAGWLGYNEDWENPQPPTPPGNSDGNSSIIDEDIFWYVEPGVNLEVNISRNFRMDFGMSRRFTEDLELINTSPKAFEKNNYYVTLKIGGF